MAVAKASPIIIKEVLKLRSFGINKSLISTSHVTMESGNCICVREAASIAIFDMSMPTKPWMIDIKADSALMNPNSKILAVKARAKSGDRLQILKIGGKRSKPQPIKSHLMLEQVVFWKWITPNMLGLVTRTGIYHWSIAGEGDEPAKIFSRPPNLENNQILNYHFDPSQKWVVLIVTAPDKAKGAEGTLQLLNMDNLDHIPPPENALTASFVQYKVPGKDNPSVLLSLATGSKLQVRELSSQQGELSFKEKEADISFPSDFVDDYPVAMQISHKYSLIYVITRLGQLFVYDIETAVVVHRTKICREPILLTTEASSSVEGFYAVNEQGQVFLATIDEQRIMKYVAAQVQLNNCVNRGELHLPSPVVIPKGVQNSPKLPLLLATQHVEDLAHVPIEKCYNAFKCNLSENIKTTPLSSRWDGDRVIEEYQTYVRDVIDDVCILESEQNINKGSLESDLIGVDCDNRARILKVRNPDPNCLTRFRFYNDELKDVLIPNMLGTSSSNLFMNVYNNRTREYNKDMLGVFKFMRNVGIHALDFPPADKFTVERDLNKTFPGALREIYEILTTLGLDLRMLSRKSAEDELNREQGVLRMKSE
ncbi:hypothetical protein M0R45_000970 [Rubus argutus]|uniref:Uncharacterized protein n=1 Tax=Rubus argutus TaxID=59490 RepID=A0AAW1VRX6_RUBAR